MFNERAAIAGLRALLVPLFALLVMLQFMSFPGKFAYMAATEPESAHLRWPLTIATGIGLLCLEVIVVSAWKLLGLISRGEVFTPPALPWMTRIVRAFVAAWVLVAVPWVYVGLHADDPGIVVVLTLIVLVFGVLTMTAVVLRSVLQQAITR